MKKKMHDKKGFFFTIDAVLASSIILLSFLLVSMLYVNQTIAVNNNYYSADLLAIFSEVNLSELNLTYANELLATGQIRASDLNLSLLEIVGKLWAEQKTAAAEGLIAPRAYNQLQCYEAAMIWAQTEGFICAPETSHAIACVIDEAMKAKKEAKEKVILFNYSGHGLMDLMGYDKYLSGKLTDYSLPEEDLRKSLESIKNLPKPSITKKAKK